MSLLAVSAIGADRPGIVAGVTGVLVEHGCNLEDTSMTILRGHFAMTLVVAGDCGAAELEAALQPVARALDLVLTVREIQPEPDEHAPARPHLLSVYGADHPGIVHAVTRLLATMDVNVTDLTTRLLTSGPEPAYVMVLEVDLPAELETVELSDALAALAAELAVEATLQPAEPDLL